MACVWRVCCAERCWWQGHGTGAQSQSSPNREIKCQVCAGYLFANISKIHLYLLASCAVCLCSAHCALVPQTFTLIVYKYFGSNKAKTPVGHMPGKWASRLTSNPDLSSNRYISYNANAVTIRNCLALFPLWGSRHGSAQLSSRRSQHANNS